MVQDYVALSHMEIQSARLLTFQTAWKMDKFGAAAVRADLGMVKAHVSKVVLAVLDRTIQVCGALGYSSDLPVEPGIDRPGSGPIGDGPDELHKSVLARTMLKGYQPVEGWPSEHLPSRRPAAEAKWAELRALAGSTPKRGCERPSRPDLAVLPRRVPRGPRADTVTPMAGGGSCEVYAVDRGDPGGCCAGRLATPARPPPMTCCASSASWTPIKDEPVRIARPVLCLRRPGACSARRST